MPSIQHLQNKIIRGFDLTNNADLAETLKEINQMALSIEWLDSVIEELQLKKVDQLAKAYQELIWKRDDLAHQQKDSDFNCAELDGKECCDECFGEHELKEETQQAF